VAEAFVGGNRKILAGGSFTIFNGVVRNRIVRLGGLIAPVSTIRFSARAISSIPPDPLPFDRDLRRAFRAAARSEGDVLIVDTRPLVESRMAEWRAPVWLPDGSPHDAPADFDGRLALVGYRIESSTIQGGC
jgi:hypothetical protein